MTTKEKAPTVGQRTAPTVGQRIARLEIRYDDLFSRQKGMAAAMDREVYRLDGTISSHRADATFTGYRLDTYDQRREAAYALRQKVYRGLAFLGLLASVFVAGLLL